MNPQAPPPTDQPVAYDTEGRPLYLHPTASSNPLPILPHPEELQVVQVTRSADPVAVSVPPEIQARHQASVAKYPRLNLSPGEYVIMDIRRHPIVAIVIGAWWFLLSHPGSKAPIIPTASAGAVSLFTLGLLVLVGLFTWVAAAVYRGNSFILTNESVIQRVQTSLISQQEKTINLENIKDAQFDQVGFLQYIVGYGSIKLTTEGDQENYFFSLVAHPKEQIATINNVIEAVKYGRPVEEVVPIAPTAS
jgi:hypothetical protein